MILLNSMNDPTLKMLSERKHLLRQLPESLPLINQYCDKLGRLQKDAVFYLSDDSDREKYEFISCLSSYDYSQEELQRAVSMMSKSLAQYMQDFEFDTLNTKVSESDAPFRSELTMYFRQYKRQKLTNRIYPEFLETVNKYALSPRPYNKLQPRSSIISHMDRKNTKLFFFDALGVEYLAFILAKCEEYGLVSEISIGHCELPSITEKNKEFLQFYADENWYKIDELDDLKHGNQIYDYEKCKLPIHLFEELEVIDGELRKIQSQLVQGTIERAVVVADHGASRLAVLYGQDVSASLILDESGEHSGRCCLADQDPRIPCAAYEDGYSILANYERFKGGRKANVEVHGGAQRSNWLREISRQIQMVYPNRAPQEITVLDAGTGPGFFAVILAEAGYKVTAIDAAPAMLAEAKRNAGPWQEAIDFRLMDAQKPTFTAESFDVVLSRNLTWVLEDPEQTYGNWRHVLKPGGCF